MNIKRLFFASSLLWAGTILLFIIELPKSDDHQVNQTVLLVQNEMLEGSGYIEKKESFETVHYKMRYEGFLTEESENLILIHQLSGPILLEQSKMPKECSYDREMTITCIYTQKSMNYLIQEAEMVLTYDEEYLTSFDSKITGYVTTMKKRSNGVEKWIEVS